MVFPSGTPRIYRFVDDQRASGFPVRPTCQVVGVSASAYYAAEAGTLQGVVVCFDEHGPCQPIPSYLPLKK